MSDNREPNQLSPWQVGESGADPIRYHRAWVILPALCTLLVGLLRLPTPPHGDQALYILGARSMEAGKVLYVDFWEIKQPGLFGFYWLAGRLFGFTHYGVHALELVVWLCMVPLIYRAGQEWFDAPVAAPLLATYLPFSYFASADSWFMSQAEALAGPWLFATLYTTVRATTAERPARWALLSGLSAGVAVSFKLVLAPIVVGMWLAALIYASKPGVPRRKLLTVVTSWVAGIAAILATILVLFAWLGDVRAMLVTNFSYIFSAVSEAPQAPWSRLAQGLVWWCMRFGHWALLATMAIVGGRLTRLPFILCSVWIVCAECAILVQRFSWWAYHQQLLNIPFVLLGLAGADYLIERFPLKLWRRQWLVAVALPAAISGVFLGRWLLKLGPALNKSSSDAVAFVRTLDTSAEQLWQESLILRTEQSLPGPIYVFGDPRILLFNDRHYAIPEHGWAWEFMREQQWQELPTSLKRSAPNYIFVEDGYRSLIQVRSAETIEFLTKNYHANQKVESGQWFTRNTAR